MCREEVVKILMIVANAYPNFHPDSMSTTADVWTTLLIDYEYKTIQASLMTYISSSNSGFAPSVSQLIAGARKLENEMPDYENEEEAWGLVYKAICKSSYYSVEEFNKLPDLCKKAIGSPDNLRELAMSDVETLQSVEKSLFVKTYRGELARRKEYDMIPKRIRNEYGLEQKEFCQLPVREERNLITGQRYTMSEETQKMINEYFEEGK